MQVSLRRVWQCCISGNYLFLFILFKWCASAIDAERYKLPVQILNCLPSQTGSNGCLGSRHQQMKSVLFDSTEEDSKWPAVKTWVGKVCMCRSIGGCCVHQVYNHRPSRGHHHNHLASFCFEATTTNSQQISSFSCSFSSFHANILCKSVHFRIVPH